MRRPLLLCAALCLPLPLAAGELQQVFDLALQNDAAWRAAGHARDAALEARPQARALLLPQLGASAQQSIQHTETRASGAATRESDDEPWTLALNLNQSIFDWAAIQQLRQANDQVALADVVYRDAAQDLVLRVAETYFAVLAAADTLQSAEAEHQAVKRQLEQAQARFEVGLSAITEVHEAQARSDLTEAGVIAAQQALDAARSALTELTGTPLQPRSQLLGELPPVRPQPADINAWVQAAGDNNLDVLGARLNAELARTGIRIAQAGHLPTVGLGASKSLAQSASLSASDPTLGVSSVDRRTDSERVTLSLNLPLFAGLATQSRVRQAASLSEQRQAEYEGARRAVERQTRDAYLAVLSGNARVKALQQAVVSTGTALEAARGGLEVGTRTFIDVLNAQQQLSAAERDHARARYDLLLAQLRLQQAAGRLAADDLQAADRLLVSPNSPPP